MTTTQVLSAAYAEVFDIPMNANGLYHDQYAGDSCIDYAHFDTHVLPMDIDTDYIECNVEDGSEGCWVRVDRIRWRLDERRYERDRCGTIKTLDSGRSAWKDMGALAGELAWLANDVAWRLYRAEREASQASARDAEFSLRENLTQK